MAQTVRRRHLGTGASCSVKLRYLHPKNKIKEQIPNQTASQQLSGLIVQSWEARPIRKEQKTVIIFRHKDFGGQLLWALEGYLKINNEGPETEFFQQEEVAAAQGGEAAGGRNNNEEQGGAQQQHDNNGAGEVAAEGGDKLHPILQELVGRDHLDNDDAAAAASAAQMVDDDNKPVPKNCPVSNKTINNIFSE